MYTWEIIVLSLFTLLVVIFLIRLYISVHYEKLNPTPKMTEKEDTPTFKEVYGLINNCEQFHHLKNTDKK